MQYLGHIYTKTYFSFSETQPYFGILYLTWQPYHEETPIFLFSLTLTAVLHMSHHQFPTTVFNFLKVHHTVGEV